MTMKLINDTHLTDISNKVRTNLGISTTYKPRELANAVQSAIDKYKNNCTTNTVTNGICTNALDVPVKNYKIYGNSTQGSNPSPSNPQEITSVGELVTSGTYTGKYKIPVTVSGKNLAYTGWAQNFVERVNDINHAKLENFDNKNCLFWGATAGYGDYDNKYMFKINWKTNTQYKIKFKIYPNNTTHSNFRIFYTDGTTQYLGGNLTQNTWQDVEMISTQNKTIKYLASAYNDRSCYMDLDTFMVKELNVGDNIYEPYHTPITTNIYLDEPLRSDKNGTIKDHINFLEQKRYNLIGNTILDGSIDENWLFESASSIKYRYRINSANLNIASNNEPLNVLSNYYKAYDWNSGIDYVNYGLASTTGMAMLGEIGFKNTDISTLADFKTWLSTHNTEITYKLAIPTEESIVLPQIKFWEGTNIVEIGTNAEATQEIVYISRN